MVKVAVPLTVRDDSTVPVLVGSMSTAIWFGSPTAPVRETVTTVVSIAMDATNAANVRAGLQRAERRIGSPSSAPQRAQVSADQTAAKGASGPGPANSRGYVARLTEPFVNGQRRKR